MKKIGDNIGWCAVWLFIIALNTCTNARSSEFETNLRLGIMPTSTHWATDKKFNEKHNGIFAELRIDDNQCAGALNYDNSFNNTSNAYYYLRDVPINNYFSWGYLIGGVTGYNETRMQLFSALTFTMHFGALKQRTLIVPLVVNGYQIYVEF